MRKIGIVGICAAGGLLSATLATAGGMGAAAPMPDFRTVGSIFGGVASLNASKSQTFVGTDGETFVYNAQNNNTTTGLVGAFLGIEHLLAYQGFFVQAGVEYDYFGNASPRGLNSVGIEPGTSTLYNYRYSLQSQQVLGVAKLFSTVSAVSHAFYPYFSVGLGAAFNSASNYTATTQETGSINLTSYFNNNTNTAFSYTLGLGIDTDVSQHLRFGLAYRFSDFGKASLGDGTVVFNQYSYPTPSSLSVSNIYANQFVAQLTYVV